MLQLLHICTYMPPHPIQSVLHVVAPDCAESISQFFSSCGWESKAAAALLIEALADQTNPQLSEKKFQHAAAFQRNHHSDIVSVPCPRVCPRAFATRVKRAYVAFSRQRSFQ